jgi:hypothetical protein
MARYFGYFDNWKTEVLQCPKCGWKGNFEEGSVEYHNHLMDCSCPKCNWLNAPKLALVSYPTTDEARENWETLSASEKIQVEKIEGSRAEFENEKLNESTSLPDIPEPSFSLAWDFFDDGLSSKTVIKLGDSIIFSEPAVYEGYERFIEVAKILKSCYGSRLIDLVPTERSRLYLYGDQLSSPQIVDQARQEIFTPNGND